MSNPPKVVDARGCATIRWGTGEARTEAFENAVDNAVTVCEKKQGNTTTASASVRTLEVNYTQTGKEVCADIKAEVTCVDTPPATSAQPKSPTEVELEGIPSQFGGQTPDQMLQELLKAK
jgi:hypothetical protein